MAARKGFRHRLAAILVAAAGFAACLAQADEADIRKAIKEKFSDVKIEKITPTPYSGLYEIYLLDESGRRDIIAYTDNKGSFILEGNLIDLKTDTNFTAERRSELSRINFDALPLNLAIKVVKGNGKRKMAVFSDPDCPYCRRLEGDLAKVTDVTIYTFLYPIDSLHPQAREKAKAIWCAPDRIKAWNDYMKNNTTPAGPANCETPLAKIAELGDKYRISGTPTIFFTNGRKVPGAIPAEQLEKMLDASK